MRAPWRRDEPAAGNGGRNSAASRVLIVQDEPRIAENLRTALAEPAELCLTSIAKLRVAHGPETSPLLSGLFAPWGAQISASFSKASALRAFARARHDYYSVIGRITPFVLGSVLRSRGTRPFYRVRLPAQTKAKRKSLRPPSGGRRHLRSAQERSAFPSDERASTGTSKARPHYETGLLADLPLSGQGLLRKCLCRTANLPSAQVRVRSAGETLLETPRRRQMPRASSKSARMLSCVSGDTI